MITNLPFFEKGGETVSMIALEGPTSTVVTAADWASIITAITGQISVSTVVAAVATMVTAGIGLVFMWWGVRKAARTLLAAFRKGRVSI